MGIIIIKIYKRIISFFKKIIWKILYLGNMKIGKKTVFYPGTHMTIDSDGKVCIGQNCFFNNGCSINALGKIEIGDYCIFGENVKLYDHDHKIELNDFFKTQGFKIDSIKIGNNCWIGSNVVILSGVKIGNNVVIGAGTIVTKDIEDNCIIVSDTKNKNIRKKKEYE